MITGKLYDYTKFAAQIVLPAVGTLYFALAQIWGLPAGAQIVGTITAIDAFLGVILGLSQTSYNKQVATGELHTSPTPKGVMHTLQLDEGPENLPSKKEVRLKVVPHPSIAEEVKHAA